VVRSASCVNERNTQYATRITIYQTNPSVSGNVVVGTDDRSGVWNVYAAVLDGAVAAKCNSIPAGDINSDCMVDFNDFAAL